jgi:hypothetical protein
MASTHLRSVLTVTAKQRELPKHESYPVIDTQLVAPGFLKNSENKDSEIKLRKQTSISDATASLSSAPAVETDRVLAMVCNPRGTAELLSLGEQF